MVYHTKEAENDDIDAIKQKPPDIKTLQGSLKKYTNKTNIMILADSLLIINMSIFMENH